MSIYFSQVQNLLFKGLDAESLRHKVISHNIANVDTPYFKKSNVIFESALKKALYNTKEQFLEIKKTHSKHMSFHDGRLKTEAIQPKVSLEYSSSYRNDKNNVDIDTESALAAKSALRYQAFSELASRNFKKMKHILNSNV